MSFASSTGRPPSTVGFELDVKAVAADGQSVDELAFDSDLFGRHWPRAGGSREFPAGLLRVGVQFADGRKATSTASPFRYDRPPPEPVMWSLSSGGAGGSWHQGYWVWPMPPPGQLELVCEWPAAAIALTRHEIDARRIVEAAHGARSLFPHGREPGPGRGSAFSAVTAAIGAPPDDRPPEWRPAAASALTDATQMGNSRVRLGQNR